MQTLKATLKTYLSGIYAGLCVVLGVSLYLLFWAIGLRPIGTVLFAVGLVIIVYYGFSLYTGKIGYAFALQNRPSPLSLLIVFLGNATAVVVGGYLLSLLRFTSWTSLFDIIDSIATSRMIGNGETWYMAFIYAFFCGLFVFLAIYTHKRAKRTWVKYLGLVFFITAFVVLGFEHCLANMFFFSIGNAWNGVLLLNIAIVIIGNSLGSMFAYLLTYL